MKISAVARPYILTFRATGASYPLGSEEVQRLLDSYAVVTATKNRVILRGDDGREAAIRPATFGGGPAFLVER